MIILMDTTDIYRTVRQPKAKEYIYFSAFHRTFFTFDRILRHKAREETDGFSSLFQQILEVELEPTLLKFFHKIETERTLPNSFNEATLTLIRKPYKDSIKKTVEQNP